MEYIKQEWRNRDRETPLSAERMNHIESGLEAASQGLSRVPSQIAESVDEKLPEYVVGPTGEYETLDDFFTDHPTGGAKVVLQEGTHQVSQLPSDGSLKSFFLTGQGSIWGGADSRDPHGVTTVEVTGPLISSDNGLENVRFSDFNLRNVSEGNVDDGIHAVYPLGLTVERLSIDGFGGNSIWLEGGVDCEVFDNYILSRSYLGSNGHAGVRVSTIGDDWNRANTTTHLQRNYVGSGGDYGFLFDGASTGVISFGDIAEGCQTGFHFHRAAITVIAPYTEANEIGMTSLDCNPLVLGPVRDELEQNWSADGIARQDRGAARVSTSYVDPGKGLIMSAANGAPYGDFEQAMSIRGGYLSPNGVISAARGSLYLWRDGTNGKNLWQKMTSEGSSGWLPVGNYTVSESELSDPDSWLNAGKYEGMSVWSHTLKASVYASGGQPEDPWLSTQTGEEVVVPGATEA